MVTQKPISLKIDYGLLQELDREVTTGFRKRNWHINRAISLYLKLQDCRRRYRCHDNLSEKKEVLNRFLRDWIPEAADW